MMLPLPRGNGGNLKSAIRGCLLSDRHIHRINFMRVEFSPAAGPKPDSLALHPALADLGPASRSIRQFGLEDQMPFRPGLPQASGRLWIARTQEPSPPDARNTACQSLYFPRGMPPAPTPLRRNWTFVPNRKYKSELKGGCAPEDTSLGKCSGFKLGHHEI